VKLEDAIQSSKFSSQKQKAGLNVLYTAWWIKTMVSKQLKPLGLTGEQYNVLRILKGKHPEQMCVRDIGCRMIEKNSNVPRIIDRLELKKLVTRSTSMVDKRETVITITPAGMDTLKLATAKVDDLFGRTVEITETEAAQLNQLLEKMRTSE
jgi:DNA-binding MarR family transcriptional regulator